MYIKLAADFVDASTGTPAPDAILVITDANFNLRGGSVVLQTAIYASATAYAAAHQPLSEKAIALSPAEIGAQAPALIMASLSILAARPELAGATVVTP
jgi:hypothetical protein